MAFQAQGEAAAWAPVPAGEVPTTSIEWLVSPIGAHAAAGAGPAEAASREHPSVEWTHVALAGIEKYRLNPLRAARLLAHLHAALHDALDACVTAPTSPSCTRIAQHAAAGQVLEYFLPEETAGRFKALGVAALTKAASGVPPADGRAAAQLGQRAAWGVVLRAIGDGADRALVAPKRPPPQPGTWRPTPPLFAINPTEPGAQGWRPWILHAADELQPPPPLAYGSPRYVAEVQEVLDVGRALTAQHKRVAEEWNLDLGTATPAGVWNRHALRLIAHRRLALADATRLLATLNVAMADAFIACWHAKLRWWTERPLLEVRERFDARFEPHLVTPPFPGYVSGHATASGAAAAVLQAYLPADADEAMRLAEEAAMSRLYGGIHFRHDNDAGLQLGLAIGRLAVQRMAQPAPTRQSTNK